ncbi:MAG TPA: glycoside hydrolase family 3 C-terminal domain-containing protein [Nocardioidaceae bacterium]|nr:glycoside hydrolase family 3 C-terminal domain-containing protein [Nocardioidaceae bacterium]
MTTPDATVDDRLASLDLRAKVRLLTGASMFTLHGDETLGLAPLALSDGPTGVRGLVFTGGPTASLFPNATLVASSWSVETAHEVGTLLAEEAQRQRIHVVLGPTINLHRSPLGGRLFEAYSEDPLLTGVLAAAYVRGLQERGTGACLKHLVANEAETDRHTVDSVVDERTLREVYLLPFEIAVADADPWSVMAAYNDVNGVPATEQDDVNNRILKGEWGFEGLLVSDWFATKSAGPAANGGLDLVMPGPDGPWGDALVAAVETGEVTESVVDEHVRRLLLLASRVGALGTHRTWPDDVPEPGSEVRRAQLTRLAAQGMTVLTNNGVLPLDRSARTTLVGRHALDTVDMGGGSAQVNPPHQVCVAEGLRARLGSRLNVVDGVQIRTRPRAADVAFVVDPETGTPGVRLRVRGTSGALLRDDHLDRADSLVGLDDDLPEQAATAVLSARVAAGAVRLGVIGVGSWTLRVDGQEHRVDLEPETADVGEAVLRPPGWSLDLTLAEPAVVVAEVDLSVMPCGRLGLVVEPIPASDEEAIAVAARAAAEAEVAVVVVGLTEEQETEAADKSSLALPGRQDELVSVVAAAAPRTIVVVNAATPVLMPWRDEVDAILWAGIPGQEGGHAVAAALLNEIEPAGRLVTTLPARDGATPAWDVVPTDGVLAYTEGPFIGYRGHAAGLAAAPAFWFGHGLGYGSWEYGDPVTSVQEGVVELRVELTNTGGHDSREVVQVYLDPRQPDQPVRLVGWSAVDVAAGKTVTATVRCEPRMWRTWDVDAHTWRQLSGGDLILARGLGDVRHRLLAPGNDPKTGDTR